MESWEKQFGELIKKQEEITEGYKQIAKGYEKNDLNVENGQLKKRLEILEKEYKILKERCRQVEDEASSLKVSLNDQIIQDKISIINQSQSRLDAYFSVTTGQQLNKFTYVKEQAIKRLEEIIYMAQHDLQGEEEGIYQEIAVIRGKVEQKILKQRKQLEGQVDDVKKDTYANMQALAEEPISEEELQKRIKANNIEVKIGLNWLNKIGMVLILIGVLTFMQYSYTNFLTPLSKGVFGLFLGIGFMGGGAYFHKQGKKVFSTGLTGGGIAILYVTTFMSCFGLGIINMWLALVLCVLISTVSFILSTTYESKTIGAFALIGGYMPLITYGIMMGLNEMSIVVCMGYVILLNLVTLGIALQKNWRVLIYLSFICNVPGVIGLTLQGSPYISMLYVVINFIMYLGINLAYPFKYKIGVAKGQIALLGIHTFLSYLLLYICLYQTVLEPFKGLMAILFCVTYILLERLIKKHLPEEKNTSTLFYITGLTFAILVIPMQFGKAWLSMGWLIEGVLLALYGIALEHKRFEKSGNLIFGLSVVVFYLNDPFYINYWLKFTFVMTGLVLILFCYLRKNRQDLVNKTQSINLLMYKYFVLFHILWYLNYSLGKIAAQIITIGVFERFMIFAGGTLLVGSALLGMKLIQDHFSHRVASGLFLITALLCMFLDYTPRLMNEASKWFYVVLIGSYNIAMLIVLRVLIKRWAHKGRRFEHLTSLFLVLYMIINMTGLLHNYLHISFETMGMSIIYVVIAGGCILYGFKRKYPSIRYLGLALAVIATGKLFIFDIAYFSTPFFKIVSYFCFGIVLLGISYVYQRFAKKEDGAS